MATSEMLMVMNNCRPKQCDGLLSAAHCYGDGCAVSGQQRCSECVEGANDDRVCIIMSSCVPHYAD